MLIEIYIHIYNAYVYNIKHHDEYCNQIVSYVAQTTRSSWGNCVICESGLAILPWFNFRQYELLKRKNTFSYHLTWGSTEDEFYFLPLALTKRFLFVAFIWFVYLWQFFVGVFFSLRGSRDKTYSCSPSEEDSEPSLSRITAGIVAVKLPELPAELFPGSPVWLLPWHYKYKS